MFDKSKIADAAETFREYAKRYIRTTSGAYRPPAKEDSRFQSFISLREHFNDHVFLDDFEQQEIALISKDLGNKGFHSFNFVAEGQTAHAYESNDLIFRISPHPVDEGSRLEHRMVRPICPLTLQTHDYYQTAGSKIRVEIMPYIVMVPKPDIPDIFADISKAVLTGTHFKLVDFNKDVGVLPDGTPVYVDPDMIDFDGDEDELQADIAKIADNTRKLELPEPFSWVLPDGRFKQDQFFAPRGGGTLIPAF